MNPESRVHRAEGASPTARRGSTLRVFGTLIAVASVAATVVLGVLLYQSSGREQSLRHALASTKRELRGAQVAAEELSQSNRELSSKLADAKASIRTMTVERDRMSASLQDAMRARDTAQLALRDARSELADCARALDTTTDIASRHRDTLDEIASAIRFGMIGVSDIPSEGFVFRSGHDLESAYRKVVDEYNDLVIRFNAAVDRSNDLGEIVNKVIGIMRR